MVSAIVYLEIDFSEAQADDILFIAAKSDG
jgi:hypothetical protein